MHYVYILRSELNPKRFYIGETSDLNARLKKHNEGSSKYTKKYRPWKIETYLAFSSKSLAQRFEKYLKRGSGKAFLKRRLMSSEASVSKFP